MGNVLKDQALSDIKQCYLNIDYWLLCLKQLIQLFGAILPHTDDQKFDPNNQTQRIWKSVALNLNVAIKK